MEDGGGRCVRWKSNLKSILNPRVLLFSQIPKQQPVRLVTQSISSSSQIHHSCLTNGSIGPSILYNYCLLSASMNHTSSRSCQSNGYCNLFHLSSINFQLTVFKPKVLSEVIGNSFCLFPLIEEENVFYKRRDN